MPGRADAGADDGKRQQREHHQHAGDDLDRARLRALGGQRRTLFLGYLVSGTSGRFAVGYPRERRALLAGVDLPAHRRLRTQLETKASWEEEFETALDDTEELIEIIASRST